MTISFGEPRYRTIALRSHATNESSAEVNKVRRSQTTKGSSAELIEYSSERNAQY